MIGVYKITNKINGKAYIGQSVDVHRRWSQHRNPSKWREDYKLYRAFKKYGMDSFSFTLIEECDVSSLDDREVFWISFYDSFENGYNSTLGGAAASFKKISNEQLEEITKLLKDTDISQGEIADRYGVGEDTISNINTGKSRVRDIDYPIRDNKSKLVYICECGSTMTRGAKLCMTCSRQKQRKVSRPSQQKLLLELQQGNFTSVARKYGVSDNAIRKWCKAYGMSTKSKDYK